MIYVVRPSGNWYAYTLNQYMSSKFNFGATFLFGGQYETDSYRVSNIQQGPSLDGQNAVQHGKVNGFVSDVNMSVHREFNKNYTTGPHYYYLTRSNRGSLQKYGGFFALFPGMTKDVHAYEYIPGQNGSWSAWTVKYQARHCYSFGEIEGEYIYENYSPGWGYKRTVTPHNSIVYFDNATGYYGFSADNRRYGKAPQLYSPLSPMHWEPKIDWREFWLRQPRYEDDSAQLIAKACDAYQCMGAVTNMITYCKEIPELLESAKNLVDTLMNLKSPRAWADLFLSTKYGWKMTYLDTLALSEYLGTQLERNANANHVLRSRTTQYNGDATTVRTLRVHYDASDTIYSRFRDTYTSGFWPTASNIWDMIPYSFVVNWVTGIGNIVDAIDKNVLIDTLRPKSVTWGTKTTQPCSPFWLGMPSSGIEADLTATWYTRSVSDVLPHVPYNFGSNTLLNHKVEMGALIAQKIL